MKLLEDKILRDGEVIGNNILKVDSFLNHQLDIGLFNEMGKEFKNLFKDYGITKILTIETSGIAIAALTAMHFRVPVLFAKKHAGSNMDDDVYQSKVFSYTKNLEYDIKVSKKLIHADD
jgi:xanthine phosphoribosyltransferase